MQTGSEARRFFTQALGDETPSARIAAAKAAGLAAIALIDPGARIPAAVDAAIQAGVALLPAVDVGATDEWGPARLIAYGCDVAPLAATDPPRATVADAAAAITRAGGLPALVLAGGGDEAGARVAAACAAGVAAVAGPPELDARVRRAGLVAIDGDWRPLVARWLAGPLLILVGGAIATGKSTLAARLAALCGAEHLASDAIRERLYPSAQVSGAVKYASFAGDAVFRSMFDRAEAALRAGRAVVCDGTFQSRALQQQAAELAAATGATFVAVQCDVAEAEQRARLAARTPGADHHSEAGPEVLDIHRRRAREEPDAYGTLPTGDAVRRGAGACLVADSTPGAAPARIAGPRTPLAVWFATAIAANLS